MPVVEAERIGGAPVFPKANVLNRFIAKFLDLLIVSAIDQIPLESSFLAALAYLFIADGLAGGQSPGKQIIGLKTVLPDVGEGATFRESIIRNFPLCIAYLLLQVPLIGWLPALAVVGFESLLLIGNPKGRRLGDELAGTQVLDAAAFEALKK